ncbi:MAG: DUF2911 domain-containing protein [Bryobacteraceae bacterium]
MRKLLLVLLPLALLLCTARPARAQRKSPHDKVTATVGGATITVEYGRPYLKGRKMLGEHEPYGKVWRTGADEATTFTTTGDLMFGSLHVPAGTYARFTIPGEKEWTVILNKVAKTWGAFDYDKNKAQDLGQIKAKVAQLSWPVEQLTISIEAGDGPNGTLKIAWETTSISVPLVIH